MLGTALFRMVCFVRKAWLTRRGDVVIGEGTYGTPVVHGRSKDLRLVIGRYTSISSGVHVFLNADHRADWVTTFPFSAMRWRLRHHPGHPASKGSIEIGNDVWVGFGAIILSGVTIGDGAIVGAGAVVAKNVGPYEIVVGNPGRIIGRRFDEEITRQLLQARWWDLDRTDIVKVAPWLMSSRVTEALAMVESVRQGRAAGNQGSASES